MTLSSSCNTAVRGILLDIEGTTTPIDFMYQALFPFARAHVKDFLNRHLASKEVRFDMARLIEEQADDVRRGLNPPALQKTPLRAQRESLVAYVHWLMDQDRKSTPLKSLQGKIWEEGYRAGELHGQVFPDVPAALAAWRKEMKRICIFSSGSVLAQKLLFKNTEAGDLTRFIGGYFDTTTGAKSDPESYRRIAAAMKLSPSKIVFVSDATAELEAARSTGMRTVLCVRPGNRPQSFSSSTAVIHTFDELNC